MGFISHNAQHPLFVQKLTLTVAVQIRETNVRPTTFWWKFDTVVIPTTIMTFGGDFTI